MTDYICQGNNRGILIHVFEVYTVLVSPILGIICLNTYQPLGTKVEFSEQREIANNYHYTHTFSIPYNAHNFGMEGSIEQLKTSD